MKKQKNTILSIIVLIISAFFANNYVSNNDNQDQTNPSIQQNELSQLIQTRKSGKIITIDAKVINVLSDDNVGDRHQRMILKVGRNTLLLAHNIDLAQRVPVKKGDFLQVRGEYEWNDKGGVIHWTHKDSRNRHPHGWIKHKNKKYQ